LITTAPITRGLTITNTAYITATGVHDPDETNNTASVAVTTVDVPITGLQAFDDSPTAVNYPTDLWATIDTGTNVTYEWFLGYGSATDTGQTIAHTYPAIGEYTAVVTATNSVSMMTATTTISITSQTYLYLPLVVRDYVAAPDLVVDDLIVTSDAVTVVVRNVGDLTIKSEFVNEFWVDVYIGPDIVPTAVNQTWAHVGTQGIVWGVTQAALPLAPGEAITLSVTSTGGAYYHPGMSNVTWPLAVGTPVYAQADSAHSFTTYGAVMENHEIIHGAYNNILGPVSVTDTTDREPTTPTTRSSYATGFWSLSPILPPPSTERRINKEGPR
jgi:PKD repeat protein